MIEPNFDRMFDKVLSWWPDEFLNSRDACSNDNTNKYLETFYENIIEPVSLESGSRLLMQLDWILYSAVHEIALRSMVVRLNEIRRSFIKSKFHELIATVGVPQINGSMEWDSSFDKDELAIYINENAAELAGC